MKINFKKTTDTHTKTIKQKKTPKNTSFLDTIHKPLLPPLCTIITASLKFKICSQAMSSLFNFAARQTICNGLTIINAIWSFKSLFCLLQHKNTTLSLKFQSEMPMQFYFILLKVPSNWWTVLQQIPRGNPHILAARGIRLK